MTAIEGYVPRRVRRRDERRHKSAAAQAGRSENRAAEARRLAEIAQLEADLTSYIEMLGKSPDCVIEMETGNRNLTAGTRLRHWLTPARPGHKLLVLESSCFALSEQGRLYHGYVSHQPAMGAAFVAIHSFTEYDRQFPSYAEAAARALRGLLPER